MITLSRFSGKQLIDSVKKISLIDLVLLVSLILSSSALVLIRDVNYLFIAIFIFTVIYKFINGYKVKLNDFSVIFSIVAGAYIAFISYSLGYRSIILGIVIGMILRLSYLIIWENE